MYACSLITRPPYRLSRAESIQRVASGPACMLSNNKAAKSCTLVSEADTCTYRAKLRLPVMVKSREFQFTWYSYLERKICRKLWPCLSEVKAKVLFSVSFPSLTPNDNSIDFQMVIFSQAGSCHCLCSVSFSVGLSLMHAYCSFIRCLYAHAMPARLVDFFLFQLLSLPEIMQPDAFSSISDQFFGWFLC